MSTEIIEKQGISYLNLIVGTIIFFIGIYFIFNLMYGINCHIKSIGEDKYCMKIDETNIVGGKYHFEIRTHSQDKIDEDNRIKKVKEREIKQSQSQECYDKGQDFNYSFDIIKDYGFNCQKLAYINDHFIDKTRQVDGGYIDGSYSGFFSYGHIEGRLYQYVTEGVLATGQLVKSISYHLDCENSTLNPIVLIHNCYGYGYGRLDGNCNYVESRIETKVINYYTESEFVMYYVNKCIN